MGRGRELGLTHCGPETDFSVPGPQFWVNLLAYPVLPASADFHRGTEATAGSPSIEEQFSIAVAGV